MLLEKLSLVLNEPGCYLMKNKDGIVIYVGKAKKLKNRLSSYFHGKHYGKTAKLVSEIVDFEYFIVGSENEALILEMNLIKKYNPKYNILLRDDKSYPYIELTDEEVPRLRIIRNVNLKRKANRLYGPYPNVTAAKNTVNLLNRIYPLRKCQTYNKKPCLYFHIGQCLGYCTNQIDDNKIKELKNSIIKFLKGDYTDIILKIKNEMQIQSDKMNYEKALELKELLDYIKVTLSKQQVEINDNDDIDIIGFYEEKGYLSVQVFFIRGSKLIGKHSSIFPLVDTLEEDLFHYIINFYEKDIILPKKIIVTDKIDYKLLEEYLNVEVKPSYKGSKKTLYDMACNNAKIILNEKFELIKKDEQRSILANEELRKVLKLDKLERIELFDNSNLFGNYNVSGMVVYIDGKEAKNEYRKYKIQDKNDDYGTMREVIYRRYFRVLKDDLPKPDLIIVDGGLGQINIAREVLSSLNFNIPVVGLKKDDHHLTNKLLAFDPIVEIDIDKKSDLFHYLERMQDEVHNYTISYHKQIRSKGSLESILTDIKGIGNKRKNMLLKKYKSLTKIKSLTIEELQKELPKDVAVNLYNYLKDREV